MPASDPAATILALRPSTEGFEVLMVHRNSRGFFGDIAVFPGGKVDDIDVPAGLSRDDDRAHRRAALREFAEETGILLAADGPVKAPPVKDAGYYGWLEEHELTTAEDDLVLVSRWVTPEPAPRRFDTRFYVVACPDPPAVEIDVDELVGHEWTTPDSGLARLEEGEWAMMRPTISHLHWLRRWTSVDDVLRSAEGADGRTMIIPRRMDDGSLLPIHMPAELR